MARLTSDLILSLHDRVSGPARGVGRSLDALERRQRLTADSAGRMGRVQSMVLAGAARIVPPLAVAETIRQTVVAAADFESALTGIQKKAGTTAAQTAAIGEEIKALATSGDLAVSIDEIAAGYERGAAAGIPLNELKAFAALSAKASDAFEMSATDVGNAAAGFKTVMGIPMNEMERYFDLINGLADSGIADESGIVNYADRAGAMGKTFGLMPNQIAAVGASLANLKVPAEVAATATNSIFTKLLAPGSLSKEGYAYFKDLVKDTKKFSKSLDQDAMGTFVGLLDKLKAMPKAARTETIAGIFGAEHLDTMLQMVEGVDEIKRNLAYAGGQDWFGSLAKSYALKLDDMHSQWQIFKNSASELMIDIGTAGMPALKEGLEGARALVKDIGAGFEAFKAKIDTSEIGLAGEAIGNLSAAITNLLGIDTSKAAIPKFMEEMADAANDIAAAINKVDAFFRKPIENWGNETVTPEKRAALKAMQPEEQYDPSSDISYRDWLQAKRKRDLAGGADAVPGTMSPDRANIPEVNASSTPSRIAAEKAMAERNAKRGMQGPNLPRDGYGGYGPQVPATPTFRPEIMPPKIAPRIDFVSAPSLSSVPVPSPRPDIVGPLEVEGAAATAKAAEVGMQILTALSVTARPVVDVSSIRAVTADVNTLAAALQRIPGLVQSASAAASRASKVDYDGIQADTTHPGF